MKRTAAALLAVVLLAGCASGSGDEHSATFGPPAQPRHHDLVFGTSTTRRTGPTPPPPGPTARTSPPPSRPPTRPPAPDARLIAPYAWADSGRDPITNAATLSLVKGIGPRAALRVLDPQPLTPVGTPQQVDDWVARHPGHGRHFAQAIYAGRHDGWTFLLEDNGFLATETAGRLSRRGAAVVIYNNVNDLDSFQYARAGHVVRDFDPLLFGPADRAHALPREHGIRFGAPDLRYLARSMLLAHRLSGLRLTLADVQRGRYDLAVAVRY